MVTFVFGWLPCVLLIDKIGRIKLQYIGFIGSSLSLLLLFLSITYFKSHVYLVVIPIIFYQISSFFGPSVTAWILPVELFKHNIRATWQSISTLIAHFGGLLAALFIPRLVQLIGISHVFICLSLIAFIGAIVTYIYKSETMLVDLK
jgi:Sugar (and other) transporter.